MGKLGEHGLGWVPDRPDPRDHILSLTFKEATTTLPGETSLRSKMPAVYDQGQLGSCTANAIGGAVQFQQMKEKEVEGANVPSRLFIYWNERSIEGTTSSDAGAMIRDGMKVIGSVGAPAEADWPYDINKFTVKPPAQAFGDALKYTATYGRVTQSEHSLKASVYFKRPVIFGFTVFESFYDIGSDGIMPMPDLNNEYVVGGHAVMVVGYKTINGQVYFEVRNSWGSDWGDNGYFWMPSAYLISPDYCDDFWHVNITT
jgi:C1A family cysteine protease